MAITNYEVNLLNIEDVRERRRRNPEPKEVALIRENILTTFSKLRFEEVEHRYFLDKPNGEELELKSVSATIHMFEPEVDWETIKTKKSKKEGVSVADITKAWRVNNLRSTTNGTIIHEFGEAMFRMLLDDEDEINRLCYHQYEDGYLIPYGPKQDAIAKYMWDISKIDSIYPILPETRVHMGVNPDFDVKHPFAGTFDMLYCAKINGKYKLLIHDYKTNKSLESPDNKKYGNMLTEPFSDMVNEPLSTYTLQLACYSLALMQLGYEIADRRLIWLKDDGAYEKIALPEYTGPMMKALNMDLSMH